MLVQIGQNSATVTPFGSLGSTNHPLTPMAADKALVVDLVQSEWYGAGFATYLQQRDSLLYPAATAASRCSHERYGCCANVPL